LNVGSEELEGKRVLKQLFAVFAVLSAASTASATLTIYDGFNYDATGNPFLGTGPSTAAGTTGNWVYQGNNSIEPRVTAGSLNYTAIPGPVGNKVALDNGGGAATGADAARLYTGTIDKTTTPTVYYSFIANFPTATSTGGTGGAFFAGFDNNANATYTTFAGLFVRTDANGTDLDLGISTSGSANKMFSTTPYPINTSLLVVGSFTFQGLSNLDVFVDPAAVPASEPVTHSATSTGVDASVVTAISNFYLRGNAGQPQGIQIDELRIGSSWADVAPVPEPGSIGAVVALSAVGLVVRRRRQV
jgi:hypothetical protein